MIVVVAVALAVIRDIQNGGGATPPTPASSASGPADARAGVPEYYVTLMKRADQPYLLIGDTFTGQTIATVNAPAGVYLDYVFGAAANDREFIVTGETLPGPVVVARWYLLRITPDGSTHAQLTPLPDLTRDPPAGAALSPDGTEMAVAPQGPATLRVYSTTTGALLRQWSTKAPGELMAERIPAGALSSPYAPLVLRWSADGGQLAFAWNATSIRVLDAAAPGGDLIASSRQLGAIGVSSTTMSNFTCHAGQGWQPVTVTRGPAAGQGIICAGSTQTGRYTPCSSPTDTTCAYTRLDSTGFLLATKNSPDGGYLGLSAGSDCTDQNQAGAYIGWANADGSVIVGSQVCGDQSRFGIFRGGKFTQLPALPDSTFLATGVMEGNFAW